VLKISIVTVCYNSETTIEACIQSVITQDYANIEHIIVDGNSTDNTMKLILRYKEKITNIICEPDNGIYDAMNKGFYASTGDIVAFLNSDDTYYHSKVLSLVAGNFRKDIDFVYGNIKFFNSDGEIVRSWRAGYSCERSVKSRQIPHPAFFIRRKTLGLLGCPFDPQLKISADLKQQLILIDKLQIRGCYLDHFLVRMKLGGESTKSLNARIFGWKESITAYNDIFGSGGYLFLVRKIFFKLGGKRIKLYNKSKK